MTLQRSTLFAFILMALAWGTSFVFIKIALAELAPVTLVAWRLTVAVITLLILMRWQKLPLPRDRRSWGHLLLLGLLGISFPFIFVSWAELYLDTGLTALLNSAVPLFTIVIAGLWLKQETVTWMKVLGLLLGFAGVALLFGREMQVGGMNAAAPLLVILACLFYAISGSYARRYLPHFPPLIIATGQVITACIVTWLMAVPIDGLPSFNLSWATIGALIWLGIFGSALAYILFYHVLADWGVTRTSLVTYVIPLVAVLIGVLFLQEKLDGNMLIGGLFILAGVATVNR